MMLLNQLFYQIQQTKSFENDMLDKNSYYNSICSHKFQISDTNFVLEL